MFGVGAAAAVMLAVSPSGDALATPVDPQPIVGGTEVSPGEFDGVVAIQAGQGLCTGTVVAPRLVLTAGHCLAGVDDTGDIEVFYGDRIDASNRVTVEGFGIHPSFCAACDDEIFDYGYVTITADFSLPDGFLLPIVDQDEWNQTMGVGGAVFVVGYGEDPDVDEDDRGIGTKRKVITWISRISGRGFEFFAGGDHRDSCQGDSGGPAFVQLTSGEWRLAGIVSRGSNPCGDGGFYGVPYPALAWVRDETSIDLCNDACGSCDCLDTAPAKDDGRCAVGGRDHDHGFGILVLLGVWARRRSRRFSRTESTAPTRRCSRAAGRTRGPRRRGTDRTGRAAP